MSACEGERECVRRECVRRECDASACGEGKDVCGGNVHGDASGGARAIHRRCSPSSSWGLGFRSLCSVLVWREGGTRVIF